MLVRLENVQKHYKQFDLNCSLEVQPECITGLIGQNGSGKTTTFKSILGLIKTEGGSIEILGKNPRELDTEDKKKIGVVLSDSGFSEYMTVKDLITVMEKLYEKFDRKGFEEKCRKFQIPGNKRMKEFSTGMKAKIKLLVAISHQAEFLLLDEPTAGLDVVARQQVLDMLREYMEEEGRSVLISSHISSDLEGLCDDLYMIDQGKVIFHEETDILLSQYGVLKVTEEQYEKLDKQYIIKKKKESFGYLCLTNEKQFYMENYPELAIEKGNIDEMILIMIGGE